MRGGWWAIVCARAPPGDDANPRQASPVPGSGPLEESGQQVAWDRAGRGRKDATPKEARFHWGGFLRAWRVRFRSVQNGMSVIMSSKPEERAGAGAPWSRCGRWGGAWAVLRPWAREPRGAVLGRASSALSAVAFIAITALLATTATLAAAQHLHGVGADFSGVAFLARGLVGPLAGAQAAFDIDLAALAQYWPRSRQAAIEDTAVAHSWARLFFARVLLSRQRSVVAMVTLATWSPLGKVRISGSRPRLPTMMTLLTDAMWKTLSEGVPGHRGMDPGPDAPLCRKPLPLGQGAIYRGGCRGRGRRVRRGRLTGQPTPGQHGRHGERPGSPAHLGHGAAGSPPANSPATAACVGARAAPRGAPAAMPRQAGWVPTVRLKPAKRKMNTARPWPTAAVARRRRQQARRSHDGDQGDRAQQGRPPGVRRRSCEQARHGGEGQHHGPEGTKRPGSAAAVAVAPQIGMRPRGCSAWRAGSGGTTLTATTACRQRTSAQVRPKMPGSPPQAASRGLSTRASANIRPMLPPTRAMALVRTLSRVRSASSAVTAADTAPAPCRPRPHIRPVSESAVAAAGCRRKNQQPGHDDAPLRRIRPMARPIMAGIVPPGYLRASSAETTGSTRNRQHAQRKISAMVALERQFLRGHAAGGRGGGDGAPWTGVGESSTGCMWGQANPPILPIARACRAARGCTAVFVRRGERCRRWRCGRNAVAGFLATSMAGSPSQGFFPDGRFHTIPEERRRSCSRGRVGGASQRAPNARPPRFAASHSRPSLARFPPFARPPQTARSSPTPSAPQCRASRARCVSAPRQPPVGRADRVRARAGAPDQ
ncbi:hypothetical protein FQR65_LT20497 [Abscondita terminalis]|nr:hypothetical protein FQR65_LT20497 [Abscondita terminalis]